MKNLKFVAKTLIIIIIGLGILVAFVQAPLIINSSKNQTNNPDIRIQADPILLEGDLYPNITYDHKFNWEKEQQITIRFDTTYYTGNYTGISVFLLNSSHFQNYKETHHTLLVEPGYGLPYTPI